MKQKTQTKNSAVLRLEGLVESVFGLFKKRPGEQPDPSQTRSRCVRCRRKYDMTKIKGEVTNIRRSEDGKTFLGDVLPITFDVTRFCSAVCADSIPSKRGVSTRQALRAAFRETAAKEIAQKMGRGPAAMNPRRSRRLATLKAARRLYREAKAGA